jgi:hypothetical protein
VEIIASQHRRENRIFSATIRRPDFSIFLLPEGQLPIISVNQAHLSCRLHLAADFAGLRRSGSSPEIIDQAQDFPEQFPRHRHLGYLDNSDGWEVGTAPSVVLVDKGAASGFTSSSLKDDIYVFFFDQKGLMAGLGLQGTKITKITPEK